MKINWKVRFNKKNLTFIARFLAALIVPILAYMGLEVTDFTSWDSVGDLLISFITNPYLIGLTVFNAINLIPDPTTSGLSDSELVKNKK
ncbi:holin [Listeria monocytogenes]|uniref:phage holin n=1 Tax=Listeria seeligeri TaxID=1640 RepID=UPI001810C84B|nr:holin [Listeria monocytogenes]EAG8714012.1 holin [Listeria monocytogenes]EAG8732383.1 holin [Listeria monocytogenes]